MGRSVIKMPYFVLTPWPPLSDERGGNPGEITMIFRVVSILKGNGDAAEGYQKGE